MVNQSQLFESYLESKSLVSLKHHFLLELVKSLSMLFVYNQNRPYIVALIFDIKRLTFLIVGNFWDRLDRNKLC